MKKILAILLVLMIIAATTNCGNADRGSMSLTAAEQETTDDSAVSASSKMTIALVMKTLTNPFFIEMEKGARKAEDEFGINLLVKTGAQETSIEQQIAIVDELISQKVDAIVIAPGSSVDLIPILKKAQDTGITIVNIDNRLDPDYSGKMGLKDVPFISIDNENAAYLAAKFIIDQITSPTNAAIIEGILGADNAEQRRLGAVRAFSENKNITIVASETANWKIDEAYTVANEIFTAHPDVRAVFCANDMMALGVIRYLSEANIKNVLVAGFDDLTEAQASVENGEMQVTINQQADIQGYLGIKYAVDLLNGKDVPPVTLVDVKVITKESK